MTRRQQPIQQLRTRQANDRVAAAVAELIARENARLTTTTTSGGTGPQGPQGASGPQGPQGSSGGGSAPAHVTVDLGGTPRRSGSFAITTSGLTTGAPARVMQAAGPYTDKGSLADEAEMDAITVAAVCESSTVIRCYWNSPTYVKGNFRFVWQA